METNETVKQTSLPHKLAQQLKIHAATRGLYMKELYEQIIFSFLSDRQKSQVSNDTIRYLASPKGGQELNIVLRKTVVERLTKIAKYDKTSVRRLLYTALVRYAEKHHIEEQETYNEH